MSIQYRIATIKDLNTLVNIRIRDLTMFSNKNIKDSTIENIRNFYKDGIENRRCWTIIGSSDNKIITTGTIYLYKVIPSNENSTGIVGQITNVWVDENFRHKGIAQYVLSQLTDLGFKHAEMICLNSSSDGEKLYTKLGFKKKNNYMIKYKV